MFRKKLRAILVPALLLFLLLVALTLLLNSLIQSPSVQRYLLGEVSKAIKYDLSAGQIEISLWGGIGITAHNFKARSRVGPEIIVASRVNVTLDAGKLIEGRVVPTRIFLFRPRVEFAFEKGWDASRARSGVGHKGNVFTKIGRVSCRSPQKMPESVSRVFLLNLIIFIQMYPKRREIHKDFR